MRTLSPLAALAVFGQLASALATPIYDHADGAQKPIAHVKAGGDVKYYLYEQTDEICDAGARQWTGWINVSDEKSLFFWFFESRSNPDNDPVAVWINGGPGGSSMMGLFAELGPCLTNEHGNDTVRNENGWTNFANMLFIDQPAGVGLSSFNGSTVGGVDNLKEASEDFDRFLAIFFTDLFPQFSHLPFHITGESFGGTYIPGFVDYIGKRQQLGVPGVFQTTIESIVLVDAVIDLIGSGPIGLYDHMCRFGKDGNNKVKLGFNETVCSVIEKAVPECEKLNHYCLETYDLKVCEAAYGVCALQIESFIGDERIPYDDRNWCNGTQPLCGISGRFEEYLNLPKVQAALRLENWNYSSINYDLNGRWQASGDLFRPTTREITWILNESPTKVLVINGNNDIIVNTQGQKRVWDNIVWNHQAAFRLEKFTDWFWPDISGKITKGGDFKAANKLAFVSFDESGHTVPGDQKAASAFILKCWFSGMKDKACSFLKDRTETLGGREILGVDSTTSMAPPLSKKGRFW